MMRHLLFLIVGVLVIGASEARAQNEPLKGRWIISLNTPLGTLPIPGRFKVGGEGELTFGDDLPLVYRERGASFSITAEVAPENSPTGQAFTLLLRGTKTSDNFANGSLLMILDTPDPLGTPGFSVVTGPFTATRQ